MRIGFLGFGEAARALAATLTQADPALEFSAWDILLEAPETAGPMRDAMHAARVREIAPEGLGACDWLISAVTADQSLVALEAIAPHLRQGQLVIDINSISPGRKTQSAKLVKRSAADYLDMAVMAPVHPKGHRTPVLVAGEGVGAARADLERLDFAFRAVGGEPGQATAIKMVRSLFVKGLEAITVEALLAAEASGCFDEIHASLSGSYPGLGWPDFASYEFERTLRHGRRRAAEMRESAATLDALGLNGALAQQIAETQERMGAAGQPDTPADDLGTLVAKVLRRRFER